MTPFYMAYPFADLYQKEQEYEADILNMQNAYSPKVISILERIKDKCDEFEFEGSRMFDEHPDITMMEQSVQQIFQSVRSSTTDSNGWLCDMVRILFWDEIYRRRCRYRRCHRCF